MLEIRSALTSDHAAVEAVHRAAFPTELEARLVRLLIERRQDAISQVAVVGGRVIGHVVLSPATIELGGHTIATGLGMAPVAVLPAYQNRGHGSALIRASLERCRECAALFVVVLGEPAFYGRFGFVPASRYGLTGEFGGDDAFQIQWPIEASDLPAGGVVRYASEFREIIGASAE